MALATRVSMRHSIEAIDFDVNLPGSWKGTDLASWLRQELPDVKIILTSGTWRSVEPDPACDLFVAKPYLHGEVLTHIKRLIDH